MKQVLATNINHSRARFLEPTSTGVIWNHGRDPCVVRTYDPEVARQTPYPLSHRMTYTQSYHDMRT